MQKCERCGADRVVLDSGKIRSCTKGPCHPFYGKKRPEHSKHMSALAASGENVAFAATLMKRGRLHNKEVNTEHFKRKILEKLRVDVSDGVDTAFSKMLSDRAKSPELRRKRLRTLFRDTFEPEYRELAAKVLGVSVEDLDATLSSMADEKFEEVWPHLHGILTIRTNAKDPICNKRFVSSVITDLKYNTQGFSTIKTRSSWETAAIEIFEKESIPWSYEEYKLQTSTGWHLPDFVIDYQGQKYIVEIKGGAWYHTAEQKEHYTTTQVAASLELAKSKGWNYSMVLKKPKTIEDIVSATIFRGKNENQKCHEVGRAR